MAKMTISRDQILSLISEEKERFAKYSELCSQYQVPPDPVAAANKDGKLEILQLLLKDASIFKS
jgi:hypothetical protein